VLQAAGGLASRSWGRQWAGGASRSDQKGYLVLVG